MVMPPQQVLMPLQQAYQPAPYCPAGSLCVPAGTHSTAAAVILALVFPGLGQFYNKQTGKGLLIIVGGPLAFIATMILTLFAVGILLWPLWVLVWPAILLDAALVSNRLNRGEVVRAWQWF